MDNVFKFFKQWDKVIHMLASAVIMLFFTALSSLILNDWTAILVGSVICIFCGAAKEIYDSENGGTCSWNDFYADLIGWGLALIPLIILSI